MTVRVRTEITAQDRTAAAFASVEQRLGGLRSAFGAISTGIAAIGFGKFIGDAFQAADEINKLSDRLNVSTEALSQYRFVADRTGVSFRNLTDGFQKLGRRVSEAAQNQGVAKDALRELGIEARDIQNLALDQQFELIADAINNVESSTDRLRLTQKLFDSENVKLLQTIKGGSSEIRRLRQEYDAMGGTLSQEAADGASQALDAWTNLAAGTKALGVTLVGVLGPTINDVVSWLGENIPDAVQVVGDAFLTLRQLVANVGAGITGFLADVSRDLAQAAEFFGADIVGKALRRTAADYEQVSETFSKVVKRLEDGEARASESRLAGLQAGITFQQIYNAELARSVKTTAALSEEEKKRRTDEERAEKSRLNAIEQYLERLQTEADTLGLNNAELVEYELNKLRATDATVQQALALQEEIETFQALAAVEEENARIFARSDELMKKGAKEVGDEWERTSEKISDGFVNAIEDAETFGDVLEGLKRTFLDIAEQQLKAAFAGPTPGATEPAPAGGSGGLAGFFKSLFPFFQHGGRTPGGGRPFVVGDAGPEIMRFGQSGMVSNRLAVDVNVGTGDPFANAQTQAQFATQIGNTISQSLSRNT